MSRSITRGSSSSNSAIVGASAGEGRAALTFLIGGLLVGSYALYKGATLLGIGTIAGGALLASKQEA